MFVSKTHYSADFWQLQGFVKNYTLYFCIFVSLCMNSQINRGLLRKQLFKKKKGFIYENCIALLYSCLLVYSKMSTLGTIQQPGTQQHFVSGVVQKMLPILLLLFLNELSVFLLCLHKTLCFWSSSLKCWLQIFRQGVFSIVTILCSLSQLPT